MRWQTVAVVALLMPAWPTFGAEPDLLGNGLSELEKSVNTLPPVKPAAPGVVRPLTPPARGTAAPGRTAGPVTPTPGGDPLMGGLDELEKSVNTLPPPTKVRPPTINGGRPAVTTGQPAVSGQPVITRQPVTGGQGNPGNPPAGGGGNLVAEQWTMNPGTGKAVVKEGRLVLGASEKSGSATANFRTPLSGDFELRVEFTIAPLAAGAKMPLTRGFGVRIESPNRADPDRLFSVDRLADKNDEMVLAAVSDQLVPLEAHPKSPPTAFRIERRGGTFSVAFREQNVTGWTELGKVEAKMSANLELWLTTYVTAGDIHATLTHLEILPAGK